MADDFTPTTQQVEDSYAYDPEYEYHHPDDPGYHHRHRAAFRRWLAEHDRAVKEAAWDEGYGDDNSCQVPRDNPHRKQTQ